MSLTNSAGRKVTSLDNLIGDVKLIQGDGIVITDSATLNGIQISTAESTETQDTVLTNGNTTTRSANFLLNGSDTQPSVSISPLGVNFGEGGSINPYTLISHVADGIKISGSKTLRADAFGATTGSSINVKSALALNSGLGIKCDSINAATTPALSIDVANSTISADSSINITSPNILLNTSNTAINGAITLASDTLSVAPLTTTATGAILFNKSNLNVAPVGGVGGGISCDTITASSVTASSVITPSIGSQTLALNASNININRIGNTCCYHI